MTDPTTQVLVDSGSATDQHDQATTTNRVVVTDLSFAEDEVHTGAYFEDGEVHDTGEPEDDGDSGPEGEPSPTDDEEETQSRSQSGRLVALAVTAELCHDASRRCYARIWDNGHWEALRIDSEEFKDWLTFAAMRRYNRPPSSQALHDAVMAIKAQARFRGAMREVYLRVAPDGDGGFFVDLGDADWRAVHVTAKGWVRRPERTGVLHPLGHDGLSPGAGRGGSIEELRPFVNAATEEAWVLGKAWLLAALRPCGPYPVLNIQGEQGSAKSTLAKLFHALIDPSAIALRSLPKDEETLFIAARNNWVLVFDNVSGLPPWMSDALCRLATGGGQSRRKNYTDGGEYVFDAQRPSILNGITEYITRPDLLERAFTVHLAPIPANQRIPESRLWAAVEAARPRILGGLLDLAVAAIKHEPSVQPPELPRLADSATWVLAAENGTSASGDWAPESSPFLMALAVAHEAGLRMAIEDSAVGPAFMRFAAVYLEQGPWEGTASELLDLLTRLADDRSVRRREWPKSPQHLSNDLRRLATPLRGVGIEPTFHLKRGHAHTRIMRFEKMPPPQPPQGPSAPSAPPSGADTGAESCDEPADARDPEAEGEPAGRAGSPNPLSTTADDADDAVDGPTNTTSNFDIVAYPLVVLVTDTATARSAVEVLVSAPVLGIACQMTGPDSGRDEIRYLALATPETTHVFDCRSVDLIELVPIFCRAARFAGHDLKSTLAFLAAAGMRVPEGKRLFDVMLAAQIQGAGAADGDPQACSLAVLADRYLPDEVADAPCDGWTDSPTDAMTDTAHAAAVALRLLPHLEKDLEWENLERTAGIEHGALPAIAWLEATGIPFDGDRWGRVLDGLAEEERRLGAELDASAGIEGVNWASPKEVLSVLRDRGHTVDGTDEATLRGLAAADPLADLVLALRRARARAANARRGLRAPGNPGIGRIYPKIRQLGTPTGRIAYRDPDAHALALDPAFRACVRAPAGRVLVVARFPDIDWRIAARLSNDRDMQRALRDGEDLHLRTARYVLYREPTAEDRRLGQALNDAMVYRMGGEALFQRYVQAKYGISSTLDEIALYRYYFFLWYDRLAGWHRAQQGGAGDTRSVLKRRRSGVGKFQDKLRSPIDGTLADGLKLGLAWLWRCRHEAPSAAPVLVGRDEVVVECDRADADRVAKWVREHLGVGMRAAVQLPVEVEVRVGESWGDPDESDEDENNL